MRVSIAGCIKRRALTTVFQPIVSLQTGKVIAYESFVRGPVGTTLESPAALFAQANAENCSLHLEWHAAKIAVINFAKTGIRKKLFVNLSADAICRIDDAATPVREFLAAQALQPVQIVIEMTEQTPAASMERLLDAFHRIRKSGAQFALDDYGTGYATLALWLSLTPEYVKIDGSIVRGVATSPLKLAVLKSLQQIATAAGTMLIAEGLETAEDVTVCRDLGLSFGQGYVLGRPERMPIENVKVNALAAIERETIAVFPDAPQPAPAVFSMRRLLIVAPAVHPNTRNDDVFAVFKSNPSLHALVVVDEGRPLAIINRRALIDAYALPFHKELFGKKACIAQANAPPLLVDISASIETLAELLGSDDQRYRSDGFVIVDNGVYTGLATYEDLVRAVTELRVEVARFANPLTMLPGNRPIDTHIQRLLDNGVPFHACYFDLNSFKPFNDQYGYWRGDEMLKLAAKSLSAICDARLDFLGHVGGDDFLVFFQSTDWHQRILEGIALFNAAARKMYSQIDIAAGGIVSEDRDGKRSFFQMVTMAAGVVLIEPGDGISSDMIATMAAIAKREAKKASSGFYLMPLPVVSS